MTTDHNDDRALEESLQDDFRTLRSDVETSGVVPDFGRMMAMARAEIDEAPDLRLIDAEAGDESVRVHTHSARTVWTRPGAWLSLAMAAAAAGLLLVGTGENADDDDFERLVAAYSADAALGAWRSPTNGLMRTPGLDLGSVPSINPTVPTEPRRPEEGRDS